MFSLLRNRFGIPGVISVIALVFAMAGGAFAANNLSSSGGASASAKGKQGKPGKPGKPGPQGPAGPQGAIGPQGPAGPQGAKGDPGQNGTNGTNGTNGKEGSPWTAGGTLPKNATETGTWVLGKVSEGAKPSGPPPHIYIPISFTIPLSSGLGWNLDPTLSHVHYIRENGQEYNEVTEAFVTPPHCSGTAAAPAADAGHLCIYTGKESGAGSTNSFITNGGSGLTLSAGAGTTGAILAFAILAADASAGGTWAVTAG